MAASAMPRDLPFQGDLANYYGWSWFANGQSDCLLVNRFLPDIQGIWICLVCGFFWHVSLNTCSKKCVSTILFSGLCRSRDKLNMWVVSWGFPREVPSRWPWKTDCWSDEYKQIPRKQNKVCDGWVFMTNHIQGCSWIFLHRRLLFPRLLFPSFAVGLSVLVLKFHRCSVHEKQFCWWLYIRRDIT